LISHPSYPLNRCRPEKKKKQEIKLLFGNIPTFLVIRSIFISMREALSARSRRLPSSTPLPKSTDWIRSAVEATLCAFLAAAAKIAAVFSKSIHGRLVAVNRPKKLLQLGRLRLQRCGLHSKTSGSASRGVPVAIW